MFELFFPASFDLFVRGWIVLCLLMYVEEYPTEYKDSVFVGML